MNPNKKVVHLQGGVVMPVSVGSRAILLSGGKAILTSLVVAIHAMTEQELCFETLNTNYCVSMNPFPWAVSAVPTMSMAA